MHFSKTVPNGCIRCQKQAVSTAYYSKRVWNVIDLSKYVVQYTTAFGQTLALTGPGQTSVYPVPPVGMAAVMCIVNYTNVCVAKCDYCSFFRSPGDPDTYLLSHDQVCERVDAMLAVQIVPFSQRTKKSGSESILACTTGCSNISGLSAAAGYPQQQGADSLRRGQRR